MGMRSPREKLMTIILAFVVIAAVWYLLFLTPTQDKMAEMDIYIEELGKKDQLVKDQIAVFKKWQEQLGLDLNSSSDDFIKIADYNNIVGLTNELNQIFVPAKSFNLSFTPPYHVEGKNAYRRDIKFSYVATSYEDAYNMISQINDMETGCLISDLSIGISAEVNVAGTISMFEFYEFAPIVSAITQEDG